MDTTASRPEHRAVVDTWYAYECLNAECPAGFSQSQLSGVVVDVRLPWDTLDAPAISCCVCGATMHFRGRWRADEGGYGSQGDGSEVGKDAGMALLVGNLTERPGFPNEEEEVWAALADDNGEIWANTHPWSVVREFIEKKAGVPVAQLPPWCRSPSSQARGEAKDVYQIEVEVPRDDMTEEEREINAGPAWLTVLWFEYGERDNYGFDEE